MKRNCSTSPLTIYAFLAVAAFLRLYQLNWKSADNDEAWSWFLASRPLPQLITESLTARGDPHPPVYWLTLKFWMMLGGSSEFSMRLPSVFLGTLYVALIYYLGRRLFSRPAALAASLFAALSACLVWNSQDARMYTLGGTLALAGIVCLVNAFRTRQIRWWPGYFLFTILACYTHLAASFLLPFEGLYVLLALARNRREWRRAFTALAAVGLTFLPFALNVWRVSGPSHNVLRQNLRFDQLLRNIILQLTAYETPAPQILQWVIVLFVAGVFIVGLGLGRENSPLARAFTALYFFVFVGLIALLSLREPVYQPKSLTFIGAALALGVGAGWARLAHWQRFLGALVGVGLLAAQLYGVSGLWTPASRKEDWRHGLAYLNAHSTSDDLALVHLEYYQVVFRYYYRGRMPIVAPFGSQLPAPAEIDRILSQYQNYDTLWLAQSGEFITDPEHQIQNWLEEHYPETTEIYPAGILIKGFAPRYRTASLPGSAIPRGVRFPAAGLVLAGYRLPQRVLPDRDEFLHPPSSWVHVTLYWSVAQPLAQDIRMAVSLEDEAGNLWGGDLPRANDLRAFYPPLKWQSGEFIRQDFDVNVNPNVSPGAYKLVVRVFPLGSETPLVNDTGEDWLVLDTVTLTP